MKILTMCRGGHVRSVGLKYRLHYLVEEGHDVLACGWESNSQETREMLYDWADYIIVMSKEMAQYVSEKWHNKPDGTRKLFCYDVGEDRFMNPFHPELQKMLEGMVNSHGLFTAKKENFVKEYPK